MTWMRSCATTHRGVARLSAPNSPTRGGRAGRAGGCLRGGARCCSPGGGSPFGDKLDELRALAGGARLSVDVLPVSTRGGDRKSAISAKRANAMVEALAVRLNQLSGHV